MIASTYNPRLRQKDSEFKTSLSYNKTLLYALTNKYITKDRSKDSCEEHKILASTRYLNVPWPFQLLGVM